MKIILFDMGLPMIVPSIFLMALALLPVIFLEAYIVGGHLRLKIKRVLAPVAIANVVSTFIGIPVIWFLLFFVEIVTGGILGSIGADGPIWRNLFSVSLGAPRIAPGGDNEKWLIFGAMLFLLIPYYLASWWVEYLVVRRKLCQKMYQESVADQAEEDPLIKNLEIEAFASDVSKAVRNANLASYALLAVVVIIVFIASLK